MAFHKTPEYLAHEERELGNIMRENWGHVNTSVCEGQGNGRVFEYLEGRITWDELTLAEKQEWKRIQPKG